MPWTVAAPAISSVIGAGLGLIGNETAQSKQQQQSDAALQFAREQAAQQQKNYEQQQAALKAQWEAQQAQMAPLRAARASILAKYGIGTPADALNPQEPTVFAPQATAVPASPGVSSFSLADLISQPTRSQIPQANNQAPGITLADLGFAGKGQLLQ